MSDLVERLEQIADYASWGTPVASGLVRKAADEITRLTAALAARDAEIARLREALGKAVAALDSVYKSDGLLDDELTAFNAARAALQEQRG